MHFPDWKSRQTVSEFAGKDDLGENSPEGYDSRSISKQTQQNNERIDSKKHQQRMSQFCIF